MAYTYLIGWPKLNKWYYGVRYAKNCSPKDLFVSYFTSSKKVHRFIDQNGMPEIIEVRKIFTSADSAIAWENKVLEKMNVVSDNKWLNETNNKAINPAAALEGSLKASKTPYIRTNAIRKKISIGVKEAYKNPIVAEKYTLANQKKIGIKKSTRSKQKLKETWKKKGHPWVGRNHSDETKRKISLKLKGKQSNTKSVYCGDIFYGSVKEAAIEHNVCSATIVYRCKNNKQGWKYA